MAQCPKCSANVTDDFGLIECGSCHAQLLVHIDGTVEFSGAGEDPAPAADLAPTEIFVEHEDVPFEEPAYEEPAYEEPAFEAAPESEPEPEPEPEPEYNFDEPEPAPVAPEPAGNASPDLSDIAAFGNSGAAGGREGALRYNLRITGVDTADVREAVREALTDRKFVWDTDEILRSIKDGTCELADVSSVKAHILITRLRQLPVEVEWEQYAIHQA